jgi:hypothetical protein
MRTIVVAFLVYCILIPAYSQVRDESPAAPVHGSPNSSPVDATTEGPDDELQYLPDEKCGFSKSLAPNDELQVVTWPIPDSKHVSRFERYGFCIAILPVSFGPEEHVIARYDFPGSRISYIKWSPDSKFLLFTTASSGGHSPWHSRTFVFCMADKSFRDVESSVGSVVSPKFHFEPPDVAVMTVRKGDSPERETRTPLGKAIRDMLRIN